MAISTNAAIYFYGTETDLSTTATTTTLATTVTSDASDLDEWTNTDDAPLASFLLEVDDWSAAPGDGETIDLYCTLVSVNSTNDEPVMGSSSDYVGHYLGSFVADDADAAQYLSLGPVRLPCYASQQEYQFYVINNTAVTMGTGDNEWRLKVTPVTAGPHA